MNITVVMKLKLPIFTYYNIRKLIDKINLSYPFNMVFKKGFMMEVKNNFCHVFIILVILELITYDDLILLKIYKKIDLMKSLIKQCPLYLFK